MRSWPTRSPRPAAEKIYIAESDDVDNYLVTPKVDVLAGLVEAASPAAVIVAASAEGKEVSGRLAARIGSGLLVDVIGINADGSAVHSIFGGAFTVDAKATGDVPVISVRPGAIEAAPQAGARREGDRRGSGAGRGRGQGDLARARRRR